MIEVDVNDIKTVLDPIWIEKHETATRVRSRLETVFWVDPVLKRLAVPHGIRSTFRDWVAERTDYPGDLAEIALAHKVGSAVEQAYRRGDMVAKRRQMMEDWGAFLSK